MIWDYSSLLPELTTLPPFYNATGIGLEYGKAIHTATQSTDEAYVTALWQ